MPKAEVTWDGGTNGSNSGLLCMALKIGLLPSALRAVGSVQQQQSVSRSSS